MEDEQYILTGEELPIGQYSYEEFRNMAALFHNYPAPGLMLGGYMVEAAKAAMPEDTLYEVLAETAWCLPDAAQMLTPCTIGNGWLKVVNWGRYAISLYDKYTGKGVRVSVCPKKLDSYGEFKTWLYKLTPKKEQDTPLLQYQIAVAGASVCNIERITIAPEHMVKRSKGAIIDCPICREPYPSQHGAICRACQGDSFYIEHGITHSASGTLPTSIKAVPIKEAVGESALHDMTQVEPAVSKGAVFKKGHTFNIGDLCQLQRIGKNSVYVSTGDHGDDWVHENDCAHNFAAAMCGDNIAPGKEAHEGKVELIAQASGLLTVDVTRLEAFNLIPGVMAACRKQYSLVSKGVGIAGTRAIPLYLPRNDFDRAMQILSGEPLFKITPLRNAKAGVLITGNEVFDGVIQDKFEDVIKAKLQALGSESKMTTICPDDKEAIAAAASEMVANGCDLIITTAGLSVDPDDVTRQGLINAGLQDILYGAPVLPGAMTLLGKINGVQTIGVPACALFHKSTSFDLLLPRLLAGLTITRKDLAALANGGMCMNCTHCSFPKCPFGK